MWYAGNDGTNFDFGPFETREEAMEHGDWVCQGSMGDEVGEDNPNLTDDEVAEQLEAITSQPIAYHNGEGFVAYEVECVR